MLLNAVIYKAPASGDDMILPEAQEKDESGYRNSLHDDTYGTATVSYRNGEEYNVIKLEGGRTPSLTAVAATRVQSQ